MVLYDLGIPIERYRWSTKTKGKTLKIEEKTTALQILEPAMNLQDLGSYMTTRIENLEIYLG